MSRRRKDPLADPVGDPYYVPTPQHRPILIPPDLYDRVLDGLYFALGNALKHNLSPAAADISNTIAALDRNLSTGYNLSRPAYPGD